MEHVEVLRDLSEVCRAAIKAGDWKVDGACDPDSLLRHADAAIASLSAPKPEGEWVLVPKDAIERAIETLENDGDEHGEGRNLRAMLDAAQQPAAVDEEEMRLAYHAWFRSEQGKPHEDFWGFGWAAWKAALARQPAPTLPDVDDDDLTVAYMAGRHDGRKEAQQPAAVDDAMVARAVAGYETGPWAAFSPEESREAHRERMRAALTAALAAQQGGSDNDR